MTTLNNFLNNLINLLIKEGLVKLTPYYNRVRIPVESLSEDAVKEIKEFVGEKLSVYLFNKNKIGSLEALSVASFHNEINTERFYFIIKEGRKDCDVFTSYAENFLDDLKSIIETDDIQDTEIPVVNLNNILERVTDVNSYRSEFYKLAEAGYSYRVLDKFHYMVNKKLGIDSNFFSRIETGLANHVTYCACCSTYLHHNNMYRDVWCLDVDNEVYEIYFTPWEDDVDDYPEYCINCYKCNDEE